MAINQRHRQVVKNWNGILTLHINKDALMDDFGNEIIYSFTLMDSLAVSTAAYGGAMSLWFFSKEQDV